jgi:hypothetical protein
VAKRATQCGQGERETWTRANMLGKRYGGEWPWWLSVWRRTSDSYRIRCAVLSSGCRVRGAGG